MDPFAIIVLGSGLALILIAIAVIWRPRRAFARRTGDAGGGEIGAFTWLASGLSPTADFGGHDCGGSHGGDAGGCDGGGGD